MPRPRITWVITDTHLYHDAVVLQCGRPHNHNELIIKNLRHLLAPQDMLLHLGDVIFYKYAELKSILDSINGTKILAMGNHDRKSASWYMNNGFNFAATSFQIDDIIFSHKPLYPLPEGIRLNIHGHWHNTRHHSVPLFYNEQNYKLLALEEVGYKPVKLTDLIS